MNQTLKISLLLLLILFASCEDLLFKQDEKYVNTKKGRVELLNGIYNRLNAVHDDRYFSLCERADDVAEYTRACYCEACSYNYYYWIDPFPEINSVIGKIYLNLYTAIANANGLIPELTEPGDSSMLGEVYFLRGYCYFKLARFFGRPYLVKDIDVKYTLEKPTYKEVYEFIEADMLKAIELLPNTYTDARTPGETPHKGMAKAVLAEIYLAMAGYPVNDASKYAEAARLAGEIIENADYYNYGLLDNFADLWKVASKQNKETVFGLFFNSNDPDNQNIIWDVNNKTNYYVQDGRLIFYRSTIYEGYKPRFDFFMNFPNDYRKRNSFVVGENQNFGLPGGGYETKFIYYNAYKDPCSFISGTYGSGVLSIKWCETKPKLGSYSLHVKYEINEVTLYLFRYAHTLLTYAEAKARAGQMDGTCFEAVNKIRRRANHLDINTPSEFDLPLGLSTEQFLDSVVQERAWELCTEPDGRWFDMLRLQLWDKAKYYKSSYDKFERLPLDIFAEDSYFLKIPEDEEFLNTEPDGK